MVIVSDIPEDVNTSLIVSTGPRILTVDEMITAWLYVKANKSGSYKTKDQYERNMTRFRTLLHSQGLDLDSEDEAMIATVASAFASSSEDGRVVAGSTYNQRIASLSSFFGYCLKMRWLKTNPLVMVERRVAHFNHAAMPFASETVVEALKSIDRQTLQGKRDYALLVILFSTGRRVSEVCNLRCGDIAIVGSTVTITWRHCKGGKIMYDQLDTSVARTLIDYLKFIYGNELSADAPVWISNSKQNRKKRVPIGIQAIANICKMYLGDSRVHSTRHTFAVLMENQGAKLSDIGRQLGHSNLSTTSKYMERLHSAENPFASKVAASLGIGED